MNSEDVSVIALEPFINKFVFKIIQNIRLHNFSYEEKQIIYADLVPKVSEKVMQFSLKKKEIPSVKEIVVPISKPIVKIPIKKQMPVLTPHPYHLQMPALPPPPRKVLVSSPQVSPPQIQLTSHRVIAPSVPKEVDFGKDYGRITPLLDDPVVSLIECQGAGKPLVIIRAGQRQITRIILSPKEIEGILQKTSDVAHIPFLEGVFRAIVDNFSINAIISDMVGSKFVIRKQTPYSLLERQV